MDKGLIKINWDNIEKYSEEEITYFLFLEGKSIEVISKIRNIDKSIIQTHIIEGKIKYRFLVKSKNEQEFFEIIVNAGKQDKISVLNSMGSDNKFKILKYIRENYVNMNSKYKETAVWILGELKESNSVDILIKASVHNHVNIRRMAVSAIGKLGDKSGEMALIRALEDTNPQVVLYSIKALEKLKSEKAYDKIRALASNSHKEYIKNAAKNYIIDME